MYIKTNYELENFCDSLGKVISIDTEFIRKVTYYSQLCLVQIYDGKKAAVIDALSPGLDLSILNKILQDPSIVKVFHSAKQDLEILFLLTGELPQNIFDTQIAASFCCMGQSISYEALVNNILNKKLDKSLCMSNWQERPLSQKQIDYALDDVIYLYDIYLKLVLILKENNRLSWVMEEIDSLNQKENFLTDYEKAWHKLKNHNKVKIDIFLKNLAKWRELKAQKYNLPRNHFLSEKLLFTIAKHKPITITELRNIIPKNIIQDQEAEEVIKIVQDSLAEQIENDLAGSNSEQKIISQKKLKQLKLILTKQAEKYAIPNSLIATTEDLKDLAQTPSQNYKINKVFNGWRNEVFGEVVKNYLFKNQDSDNKEEV